ncbi:MAG: hypothetical protein P9X24_19660 [Candidatus Hatepunaea meridiana]|nr:hypothetical protein [Candidatus Hatepunaea meridiana]
MGCKKKGKALYYGSKGIVLKILTAVSAENAEDLKFALRNIHDSVEKSIITGFPSHFVIPAKAGIQSFQVFKALQPGFPPSRE